MEGKTNWTIKLRDETNRFVWLVLRAVVASWLLDGSLTNLPKQSSD